MQAAKLPFLYGWYWIQEGLRLFKLQPAALFFWSLITSILINLSNIFPIFGQMVLIVLVPTMTFIIQNACRRIDAGEVMRLGMWTEPLKPVPVRNRLIKLGFIYLLACLAVGFIATFPFVSELSQLMDNREASPEAIMAAFRKPIFLFFILYLGLSALFWHAPALVGWHAIPVKQALFFSMVACWRNKAAFLLYGLCWAAAFFAIQTLGELLLGAGLSPGTATLVLTPINLAVAAILYASFYPAYRSVFGDSIRDQHRI
ncbi:BPSS1780 family membrane protein [Alcaligenes faecalis]|nr:BPSS1780 family membrane protein [Alcaligenes faecalis]